MENEYKNPGCFTCEHYINNPLGIDCCAISFYKKVSPIDGIYQINAYCYLVNKDLQCTKYVRKSPKLTLWERFCNLFH